MDYCKLNVQMQTEFSSHLPNIEEVVEKVSIAVTITVIDWTKAYPGMVSYYSKYIKNYAMIAVPLKMPKTGKEKTKKSMK